MRCNNEGHCLECKNTEFLAPECTHTKKGNLPSELTKPDGSKETVYKKCQMRC